MKTKVLKEPVKDDVPRAVSVIISPDSAEIDMHMTLDPLAVDPLLTQNVNVKEEIKQEKVSDENGTDTMEEDPLRDVPNISTVPSVLPPIPRIKKAETPENSLQDEKLMAVSEIVTCNVSSEEEVSQSEDENLMAVLEIVSCSVSTKEEVPEHHEDERVVANAVSVIVPCGVSTEEEISQCNEMEDPLGDVPSISTVPSVLPPIPRIHKTETPENSSQNEEPINSSKSSEYSTLQRLPRNEERVEAATLGETANETTNTGRATRRSAAIALAAIRRSKASNRDADSNSSESDFENSDENYQSEEDSSEEDVVKKKDHGKRKKESGKGDGHTMAPWCSCGKHSCSALDKIDHQVGSCIVYRRKTGLQPTSKDQQTIQTILPNQDNSLLESNSLHDNFIASKSLASLCANVLARGQKKNKQRSVGIEYQQNAVLIATLKDQHIVRSKLTDKNNSLLQSNDFQDDSIGPEALASDSRNIIAHGPDKMYQASVGIGSHQNSSLQTSLKRQQMTQDTFTNRNHSLLKFHSLHDDFIASRALATETINVTSHSQKNGKRKSDFVDAVSNTTVSVGGSKETQLKNSLLQNNLLKDSISESCETLQISEKDYEKRVLEINSKPPERKKMQDNIQVLSVASESNRSSENQSVTSPLIGTQHSRFSGPVNNCSEVQKDTCKNSPNNLSDLPSFQSNNMEENQNNASHQNLNSEDSVDESSLEDNPDDWYSTTTVRRSDTAVNCSVCGVRVIERYLKQHMLKHSEHRPFKCKLCCKTFKTIYCLKSHMNVHSNNKIYKCSLCEKQYRTKIRLINHIKILHEGEPANEVCNICGKTIRRSGLKRHMQTHSSSESGFSCKICGKKFPWKHRLCTHMRNVHGSKKPYTHICEVCGAELRSPSLLKDHMNTHLGIEPYVCRICSKSFAYKIRLRCHINTHQEKKYKCDTCGFACCRVDNLITHIRSHTGDKPFKCTICSKTFTRLDNLRSHEHRVHKVQKVKKINPCKKDN